MKNTILLAVIMTFVLTACNSKSKQSGANDSQTSELIAAQLYSCPMHPEMKGKQAEKCSKCGMELTEPVKEKIKTVNEVKPVTAVVSQSSFSITEIVNNYLNLKNALSNDDSKRAATSAKALLVTFKTINSNSIGANLKNEYNDIADDAKEHAQHIGDNAGKIEHQREHFAMLSKDMYDLIKTFGTTQKLYQDYCPMYDQGKSGYWISETKEINNPYFGSKMKKCGVVKKEF